MKSLILSLLVFAVCAPPAGARTWTDSSGTRTIEAEFVEFKDGSVQLRREDGTIVPVPIDKLSAADQEFVRKAGGQPREEQPDAGAKTPRQPPKATRKPPSKAAAKDRAGGASRPADAVEELLALVRNEGDNRFTVDAGPVQSSTGTALALGIVKADAKFRLKDSVTAVQNAQQEHEAVEAILKLIKDIQGKGGKKLSEKEYKAVCFLATEALFQLSDTSTEALTSLRQLQNHKDPVIAAQAKLQMVLLKPREAAGRAKR